MILFIYGFLTRGAELEIDFSLSFSHRITAAFSRIEDMAEGPDPNVKALDELEKDITCAVCFGHYQEAKLLSCNHYYCRACIELLAKRSQGLPFPCPECRKDTTLPSGGVEHLQSAFFVERMKDVFDKMAKVEGKVEAVCEQCSKGISIAFCRQCTDFICAECTIQHGKLKVFADHKVATLEELKKGGAKEVPLKEAPLSKCLDHDELRKIFCFDCNYLICRDCLLYDHREHKSDFVKKCAAEARKTLRDSLTPLQKMYANVAGADKKLAGIEAQVGSQKEEVSQTIKKSFCQLKVILEQRETKLLKKVQTLAQEKKDALTAQRKGLQITETEIQSLVEFVERNVENTSDQDLMGICTQLQAKVEEGEKLYQQLSLDPATTVDITCCPPSPDDIPRDLGEVFLPPHQPLFEVGDSQLIQLGKSFKGTLMIPDDHNPSIQAELQSLADPASSVQVDVVGKGAGVYHITCTPRVRGRHDLTVKVSGQNITGSPFRVFVKIHPTQLGPPVRTITGVSRPWGIATNSKQQLVVAEDGEKKITVRGRDGKTLQTIKNDKFQSPAGVATGPDGAIYVTDDVAHCVLKFDKDGRLLKTVESEFQSPYFIKAINSRLYVSDYDRNVVEILDLDCNVIGTIPTKECPKPHDIAEGDGGLYVVGGGEGEIGVYTCAPNGEFRHHLNIQPSSVTLSYPWGICFDCSGHIFVTQSGSDAKYVHVFKPSGEHVATLGQASSGVKLGSPVGIAIDEDGFVYVCDCDSSKNVVVVF